jgi:GDPmannose 4,6-dehydratase
MSKKKALICGISGQDGAWLSQLLLKKDYCVCGTSRDAKLNSFQFIKILGIFEKISFVTMQPENFQSVLQTLAAFKPDEVYFLSGQSSVGISFDFPEDTIQSITLGILNLLEVCKKYKNIKLYNAGSSECFGDTGDVAANEKTPFHPLSPYAVAKSAAFWMVDTYRKAYNLHASTGILFNHESQFRSQKYVTQKIVSTAISIANGSKEILELGRLDISRDWGWAPEYVEAIWLIMQQKTPMDFVIATGTSHSLEEFTKEVFSKLGLEWRKHVCLKKDLLRPVEIIKSRADPSQALKLLNWKARAGMKEVVSMLVENKIQYIE